MNRGRAGNTQRHVSHAAQVYLLTSRSMVGAGGQPRAASLARRMGVSTQAASEMVARLMADGLVTAAAQEPRGS